MSERLGVSTAKGFNSTDMERVELFEGEITYNLTNISFAAKVGRTYIFSVYLDTLAYAHTFVLTIADNTVSISTASKFRIVNGAEISEGLICLEYNKTSNALLVRADTPSTGITATARISYIVLC